MPSSELRFVYAVLCGEPGCVRPAEYKIAAPWSDGTSRELKTYALACPEHRGAQLRRAQARRRAKVDVDVESLGPIGIYARLSGRCDAELSRLPDPDPDPADAGS